MYRFTLTWFYMSYKMIIYIYMHNIHNNIITLIMYHVL